MASATMPLTENAACVSRLFAEHHRRILVAAYRITGSMADAEDVAQTVFLRLADSDAEGMKNPGSYLYRAAINGALDLLRRRKIIAAEPLESANSLASDRNDASPDAGLTQGELVRWFRLAISELAPRAAEMFTLRYLEELDNREIARCMGTSQAVVAVTLHHARKQLKKRLRELERGKR
jgi:RNA polymerase sigma factor (sigma-70 family)